MLSAKLYKAHSLCQKMAEEARLISQGERKYADFEAITPGLSMALTDLLSWTKPPSTKDNDTDHEFNAPADLPAKRTPTKLKWFFYAMQLVEEHPDWTDSQIAEHHSVKKHPGTLCRHETYQQAAAMP